MKDFQKVIKYLAIAFGLYLAITIISAIVAGTLAIFSGIYGVNVIKEQMQIEGQSEEIVLDQFSKIDLEIATANIEIKSEGNVYKIVTYEIPKTTMIENNNSKLEIKDTQQISIMRESQITIYVPENTTLEEIELEMGAGSLEITKLISEKAKIECGAGQVILEEVDFTDVKIDTGVGKVSYSGFMRGNSKLNCGVGEVKMNLSGGSELYSIDANKGIGEISINGKKITSENITGHGENKISIDGGIGNINIKM